MKKRVKIKLVDWPCEDTEENFYNEEIIKILQRKYDVIYSDNPDFIICSICGVRYLEYDCVRIFFTAENRRTDYNVFDYGIDFDFMDFGDRHLRVPFSFIYNNKHHKDKIMQREWAYSDSSLSRKSKFCGILVSNARGSHFMPRKTFFEILSQYKRVDSGGRWNNNIGYRVTDKIAWLEDYKFNICFENSSHPGYFTEKLLDSVSAGCIPIYWGDTSLRVGVQDISIESNSNPLLTQKDSTESILSKSSRRGAVCYKNPSTPHNQEIDTKLPNISTHLLEYKINPKCFVNAHNFTTFHDLKNEIIRIDNNKDAYIHMLKEPIFLDNFDPFAYYEEKLFNFLDSILSQDRDEVIRRGNGQIAMGDYEEWLKKVYDRYYLFHRPRNMLRDIKRKILGK